MKTLWGSKHENDVTGAQDIGAQASGNVQPFLSQSWSDCLSKKISHE